MKTRLKMSRPVKMLLTFLLLAGAGAAILVGAIYYQAYYGRIDVWYRDSEKQLSDRIVTHDFNDGSTRVYDLRSRRYTTPRVGWVADAPEHDSLTVFRSKAKRGFLNVNDGRIIIEAQYDKAWVFSEGLAAVVQEDKIGFINARNEVVLPFRYDYAERNGMGIDYLFRDGYCVMTDARGACGIIDRTGNWVLEPRYDCIWAPHGTGYRIVKDGDKYGLLNPDLQLVFPVAYDYIDFAADDAGLLFTREGRKWQTDFNGMVTRPFVVDYTNWLYYPGTYNEETGSEQLSEFLEYRIDSRVGVLRRDNGKIVIPAIYEHINMLSEKLFEAQLREEGNWILIDTQGNIIEN